ncbi:hypothetical protein CA234_20880 [Sphingomonas sp. ABOLE]|nr:hypothetical protein CA234_20880 [Sphingomonas sp. ABOLE]
MHWDGPDQKGAQGYHRDFTTLLSSKSAGADLRSLSHELVPYEAKSVMRKGFSKVRRMAGTAHFRASHDRRSSATLMRTTAPDTKVTIIETISEGSTCQFTAHLP